MPSLWKRIDPHFQDGDPPNSYTAPSPIARFIGNDEGWKMAMKFLEGIV